jgi:NAD(P)-dependent dehydrogenase (short-subunit alcohol dehydrogenase family)
MHFSEKIIVIIGGSKGFGKALAQAFIQEGAKVTITSTNADELQATAQEIGADHIAADAGSFEETAGVVRQVVEKFGKIDVWVNNAGVQIAPGNTEDVDMDKLRRLFDINFFGYFNGCKAVLPIMKQQHGGVIININSTAALGGKPGLSAYVSSKFAIKGLSETIREEVKGTNMAVYQIFPGGMQTDIYHEKVPADINEYMQVDYAIEKVMANLTSDNPEIDQVIKRPGVS